MAKGDSDKEKDAEIERLRDERNELRRRLLGIWRLANPTLRASEDCLLPSVSKAAR